MEDEQRRRVTRSTASDHFEQVTNNFATSEEMTESECDEEDETETSDEEYMRDYHDLFNIYFQPELGFLEEEEEFYYGEQEEMEEGEVDLDELSYEEMEEDEVDLDELSYEEMEEDEVDLDELSYEELIALGEMVGVESRGLAKADISGHLHPFTWKPIQNSIINIDRCVICQIEYEGEEKLVKLPCDHPYHSDCITQWLQIKKICPICGNEVSSASLISM